MIHYNLLCSANHAFDGWFRDSAAFEAQEARGLLECPVCGERKVARALMAPALPRKRRALAAPVIETPAAEPSGEPTASPGTAVVPSPVPQPTPADVVQAAVARADIVGAHVPDQVRAMLQKLRAEVERRCDYVGDSFADEARKIHRGETNARSIYGETTPEQAEALLDEGIEVARIPWVPRADG